jgi:hypothetical protein
VVVTPALGIGTASTSASAAIKLTRFGFDKIPGTPSSCLLVTAVGASLVGSRGFSSSPFDLVDRTSASFTGASFAEVSNLAGSPEVSTASTLNLDDFVELVEVEPVVCSRLERLRLASKSKFLILSSMYLDKSGFRSVQK